MKSIDVHDAPPQVVCRRWYQRPSRPRRLVFEGEMLLRAAIGEGACGGVFGTSAVACVLFAAGVFAVVTTVSSAYPPPGFLGSSGRRGNPISPSVLGFMSGDCIFDFDRIQGSLLLYNASYGVLCNLIVCRQNIPSCQRFSMPFIKISPILKFIAWDYLLEMRRVKHLFKEGVRP